MNLYELGPVDYQKLALVSLSETELLSELLALQQTFTTSRESSLEGYAFLERAVSAYLQFYTPTNMPKLDFLLNRLSPEVRQRLQQGPFIDYGSGPGTFSAAWLNYFGVSEWPVYVIDKSDVMLAQAKKFLVSLFPDQEFIFSKHIPESALIHEKANLFFGHVLNEIEFNRGRDLMERFQGKHIMWIEPGTPAAFSKGALFRRFLMEKDFKVHYPCLAQARECPALEKQGQEWCHQVMRVTWPEWIERISQKIKLDRRTLPLMAHMYERGQNKNVSAQVIQVGEKALATLVRVRSITKHSFEWEVCVEEQAQLKWLQVSVMQKGLKKADIKKLSKINTGERILIEWVKPLADGVWRVQLLE